MTLESLLIWIVVGAIAGILADAVVGRRRMSLGAAILIGIIGAIIGGWLFDQLGISLVGGIVGTIVEAFIGAVILLLILSGFRRV